MARMRTIWTGMYNDQNTLEKVNDVHKEEIITGTNIMFGGALKIG